MSVVDLKEKRRREVIQQFFQKTGKIPRPPCFKCKHKVPEMNVTWDDKHDDIQIELKCHKESEFLRIPVEKINQISKIEIGWAFYPTDGSLQEGKSIKELH